MASVKLGSSTATEGTAPPPRRSFGALPSRRGDGPAKELLEVRVVAPKEASVFLDRRMEFQLSPPPCERCGATVVGPQCAACGHRRN